MSVGKTAGWTLGGLLLGVLAGFASELFRRQSSATVQQRYVAPEATRTPDARTPAPVPEPAAEPAVT
ncbi:hypothetical protein [Kribbella solani]|uniref:hypothetical protein n=1 Tax=Kribbella solani TaxID=236067 RepID=UPI0029AA6606|nr:hypothetical protein [Kribbella solani]MDX2969035.1 hypothetical protein [Kribbella solani]